MFFIGIGFLLFHIYDVALLVDGSLLPFFALVLLLYLFCYVCVLVDGSRCGFFGWTGSDCVRVSDSAGEGGFGRRDVLKLFYFDLLREAAAVLELHGEGSLAVGVAHHKRGAAGEFIDCGDFLHYLYFEGDWLLHVVNDGDFREFFERM